MVAAPTIQRLPQAAMQNKAQLKMRSQHARKRLQSPMAGPSVPDVFDRVLTQLESQGSAGLEKLKDLQSEVRHLQDLGFEPRTAFEMALDITGLAGPLETGLHSDLAGAFGTPQAGTALNQSKAKMLSVLQGQPGLSPMGYPPGCFGLPGASGKPKGAGTSPTRPAAATPPAAGTRPQRPAASAPSPAGPTEAQSERLTTAKSLAANLGVSQPKKKGPAMPPARRPA